MPLFTLLLLLTSTTFVPFVSPSPSQRNRISASDLRPSYDCIIPGGGLAGLILASRLSEDLSVSVLVLEGGASGDEDHERIDTPSGAYFTSIVGTQYDWAHLTVPQGNLDGRVIEWPRGKVLGGSTDMNTMYLVRPSSVEIDAWAELLGSMDDDGSGVPASTYDWQSMHAAMRKSGTFVPPLAQPQRVGNIQYEAGNYGSGGPMSVSYPAMQISVTGTGPTPSSAPSVYPLSPHPTGEPH